MLSSWFAASSTSHLIRIQANLILVSFVAMFEMENFEGESINVDGVHGYWSEKQFTF